MMDRCDVIYLSVDADALNPWLSRAAIQSGYRGISTEHLLAMLEMLQGLPIRAADLTGHLPPTRRSATRLPKFYGPPLDERAANCASAPHGR